MREGNGLRNLNEMLAGAKNASDLAVLFSAAVEESDEGVSKPYVMRGGDSLLATEAPEGLGPLAELFGQELEELRE